MLFQKILKPASASIQYIGATTASGTTSGGTVTVSLTGLTGGIASSPSIGDIVLISIGVAGSTSPPATPTVTGYTQIATVGANDTNATTIYTGYKILTSADTSVAYTWTASNGSSTAYVSVWRNVDATYPLDVTTKTISQQNGILINPAAITPITSGAYVVVAGAGASSAGAQTYSSSDLSDFRTLGANNTYDSLVGGGYKQWSGGAFDPAAFTFSTTDSATYSCAATTLALRPVGRTVYPSFVASTGAVSTTLSVPSHQSGDWIVFVNSSNTTTIPALTSGFTNITTFTQTAANNRSVRVQYKVSDGTLTTLTTAYAGSIFVLRNVNSLGSITSVNSTAASSVTSINVSLSPSYPGSIVLFGSNTGAFLTGATGLTVATSAGGYKTTGATESLISGTLTFSAIYPCYFGAEFY